MSAAGTVLTTGSTYDNLDNLAPSFRTAIMAKYEGTTLGRQELLAELLDEAPGALWKRAQIDAIRADVAPDNLRRVVIGVDPAVTNNDSSDATGIVAVGMCENNLFWVLEDASRKDSPLEWARAVVDIFKRHRADSVIAESNQGGELVREIIHQHDAGVPVSLTHASRGKYTRAEPVAMLYEQGRVKHLKGMTLLEDEMCNWVPGESSPDRMDALVHAITHMNTTNTAPSGAMVLPGGVWG
jgi:phage terminase large subunit-like protein